MANYGVGLAILADSADPSKAVGAVSERDVAKAAASGVDMARPIGEMATRSAASVEAEGRVQGGRARADYIRRGRHQRREAVRNYLDTRFGLQGGGAEILVALLRQIDAGGVLGQRVLEGGEGPGPGAAAYVPVFADSAPPAQLPPPHFD